MDYISETMKHLFTGSVLLSFISILLSQYFYTPYVVNILKKNDNALYNKLQPQGIYSLYNIDMFMSHIKAFSLSNNSKVKFHSTILKYTFIYASYYLLVAVVIFILYLLAIGTI